MDGYTNMYACSVVITKNGIELYDGGAPLSDSHIISYLSYPCSLGTLTIGQFLETIGAYPSLVAFFKQYSSCPIEEYIKQGKQKLKAKDVCFKEGIERAVIRWYAYLCDNDSKTKELSMEAIVFGENKFGDNKCPKNATLGLGLCSIAELKDVPLILKNKFRIYDDIDYKKKPRAYVKATKDFTLLEVIDSVLNEIGFYGPPEEKVKIAKKLNESMADVKNGKAKTIPWEKVQKKLEKQIKAAKESKKAATD